VLLFFLIRTVGDRIGNISMKSSSLLNLLRGKYSVSRVPQAAGIDWGNG